MLDTLRSFFAPPFTSDLQQNRAKLVWVVRLRWIALVAQVLSILPAVAFRLLEPALVPEFLGIIGALALLNTSTWFGLRRGITSGPRQLFLQLLADICALSALLALTGGAWNPLLPILFVHSVLGAMLLEGRFSWIFFSLLILCLILLQSYPHIPPGLEGGLLPAEILFPAQLLVALVFWILTAWLARTLNSLQSEFAFLRERRTRIDRLRAVGALAAGLSHEFATPLNTAQLRLTRLARKQQLTNDVDVTAAREALDRCEDILRHMSGSQLEPERLRLEDIDVAELVEQVCNTVSRVHEDITIHTAIDHRGSRRALLPSVAFSQAILNLIDNAVESGGNEKPIEVIVRGQDDRIEVAVLDHGPGWPQVVRSHIGEPFVTTKPDGVGLGLYYVHSLSEAVGADFSLEDRPEGGAMVRISLPTISAVGKVNP